MAKHLRRKEILQMEEEWEKEKELLELQQKIKREKRKLHNPFANLTTSKLLILFLFINCTLIELFTGWVTIKMFALAFATGAMMDFTPLVTLIGAVVGEVIGFAVYALKSMKENTCGGIIYDSALKNINNNTDEESVG